MPTETVRYAKPSPDLTFEVTSSEARLISKIVTRAKAMYAKYELPFDRQSTSMDITATHANGNPLRLRDLLAADDFNFAHDVFGIARHIDRSNGKMTDHFSPRFSARGR